MDDGGVLLKALCAMVVRLSHARRNPGALMIGLPSWGRDAPGLTHDEMRMMAMLSRRQLASGKSDTASEIHGLLSLCTQPLDRWFPNIASLGQGFEELVLVDADTGLGTEEAFDLARGFGGLDAELENSVFSEIRGILSTRNRAIGCREYTALREFIIRNPVCTRDGLDAGLTALHLPSSLVAVVYKGMYEAAPLSWANLGKVDTCGNCGNVLLTGRDGSRRCRTRACHFGQPHLPGPSLQGKEFLAVKAPIQVYWVESGVDEIRLFDALAKRGHAPQLYPEQDRVDISFGDVGIDLKNYSSPVFLGRKLSASLGGLKHYTRKWLVIPDRHLKRGGDYRSRLMESLGATAKRLSVYSVSEALEAAGNA